MRALLAFFLCITLVSFMPLFGGATFSSELERAFELVRAGNSAAAAAALDMAAEASPELFEANNLHYLRGRLAEDQEDWEGARKHFDAIAANNPLRPLAAWRAAMAAARLGQQPAVATFMTELPANFPADLKMQIAAVGPADVALSVYQNLSQREARLKRAELTNDTATLWKLLRERSYDDVSLAAARTIDSAVSSLKPDEMFDLAQTFFTNRQFDDAFRLFEKSAAVKPAESRYQMGRVRVLRDECVGAVDEFTALAKDFPKTSWQSDAEYQIANCYWRMNDFKNAEKAYADYIARYGGPTRQEGMVRNLVDVHRVLGEHSQAIALIDRSLALKISTLGRQVLQFAKAKILFLDKKYASAAPLFRQLARTTKLETGPGATTKDEARYFEALSTERSGNTAQAQSIYRELGANPRAYYGQKANARLGKAVSRPDFDAAFCAGGDRTAAQAEQDVMPLARPLKAEPGPPGTLSSALAELAFLRLWDDAAIWVDLDARRDSRAAASIAYLAGRYDRSIRYAGRLPMSDAMVRPYSYPTGYRSLVCEAAQAANVDPQWLHAIIWQESKYDTLAKSGASARGLMQFIPETANAVAKESGIELTSMDQLYNPAVSIQLGARYWASLMAEFKSPELALAAYNGGPENVRRWKAKAPGDDTELFVSDIGFVETKAYVQAVFSARAAYAGVE
jgi:soluble lytic murein transglycosylase-like protein/outer membrane protein assembly factor BamD (BamD/ComL family)